MKIISIVTGIWFFFCLCAKGDDILPERLKQVTIRIQFPEDMPGEVPVKLKTADSVYVIKPGARHVSEMVVGIAGPEYATFVCGPVKIPLFLENGRDFSLRMDFRNRQHPLQFEGKGAPKNEYLNLAMFEYRLDNKLEGKEFIGQLENLVNRFYGVLDSLHFEPEFVEREKERLYYDVFSALAYYPFQHAWPQKVGENPPSAFFYDYVGKVIQSVKRWPWEKSHRETYAGWVAVYSGRNVRTADPWEQLRAQLEYVGLHFTDPQIREYLVDRYVVAYIRHHGIGHLPEIARMYEAEVKDLRMKQHFADICQAWERIKPGAYSPAFRFPDPEGRLIGSDDLKGTYLLLDVWATWCGPCRNEMKALKALARAYKDRNIRFVGLSCDDEPAMWKKVVQTEELPGIQLNMGKDKSFMEVYKINRIPRFILLDPEGKIIDPDFSLPSEEKTKDKLNRLEGL